MNIQHPKTNYYQLKWDRLTLTHTETQKCILKDCSGLVSSGMFMAIMGASGAGKSSLLSIITARLNANNTKLAINGTVELNGAPYNLQNFSKISTYVQQDDLLFGTLTVRQTFLFQAQLKLWKSSKQEQQQRCDQLISKLNLRDCAHVLVGNSQFKKSISGGQKKRVSIGVELISNPHVLIFDEPTSGLDSHNALIIIKLLSKLAKEESKLIITTIHQPSTLMFQNMDRLYLLKRGECIYDGLARNIVGYMQSLEIQVDYRMNPADFFMFQISPLKEQGGYRSALNAFNMRRQRQMKNSQSTISITSFSGNITEQQVPLSYQFKPLMGRALKNFYRSPSNQLNKLVTAIMIPLLFGILFFRIAENAPQVFEQSYFKDFISFLFMGPFFLFAMNVYDTTMVFPSEKELVVKQAAGNLYSLNAYYLSRLVAELPGSIIPALICSLITYFTAGFEVTSSHIFVFVGMSLLVALQGYFFGLFFGVLCKTEMSAINLLPMVMIPIMMFGGLMVNIKDISVYISWMQYFSPMRHTFLILFQDQMKSSCFEQYLPLDLPKVYGIDGDAMLSLLLLVGLLLFYFIFSLVMLHLLIRRKL